MAPKFLYSHLYFILSIKNKNKNLPRYYAGTTLGARIELGLGRFA